MCTKGTLVRTNSVSHTIDNHRLLTTVWTIRKYNASSLVIINTDGEEETGQFQMEKGQWVTDNGGTL